MTSEGCVAGDGVLDAIATDAIALEAPMTIHFHMTVLPFANPHAFTTS
jgi:hypothetical protein